MKSYRIELGTASVATCGAVGPVTDKALGIFLPGLNDD